MRIFNSLLAGSSQDAQDRAILGRNRIYILPTRAGMVFFILLLTMLLISINYNNPPGYLLTFLLAGVGFVSIFHAHRTLYGLVVGHESVRGVFAGGTAHFPVLIRNPGRVDKRGVRAGWTRLGDGPTQDLPKKGQARFLLSLPAPERGRLAAGPVTVSTVHPLGFLRAWSPVRLATTCTVYPKPERDGPGWPQTAMDLAGSPDPPGGAAGSGQDGEDFSGLRAYRAGDPPRQVAWKATARSGAMFSKEFALQRDDPVIWLQWGDAAMPDPEARLSRLCRWVLEADRSGRPYGLVMPGAQLGPSSGPGHLTRCLTALALFEIGSG